MRYDLVVVGMGSGGLVAAEFAASLGLEVAAVERERVGGDCLWTGCVLSKTLLASAKVAHHMRTADRYGLPGYDPAVDLARVWERVRSVQQDIAESDDDPARYRAMGIDVIFGRATLAGPHAVRVDGRTLSTRSGRTGDRRRVPLERERSPHDRDRSSTDSTGQGGS